MNRPTILHACIACLLLAATLTPSRAEDQRIAVPLSSPDRPVRLSVDLFSGQIEVTGYDGNEVVVVARSESRKLESGTVNGMKRIPNTSMGLTIAERANFVSVESEWMNRTVHVRIQVPYHTSAKISSVNQGNIVVRGLTGELELENTNGGIEATDISGSVVANTTNGPVKVTFVEVLPDKAMSFATLNGNVDVSFPPDIRADLRINGGRGDVLTDFDVEVLPTKPEIQRSESGRTYKVELGRDVHATIGGGGPTYRFETMNGGIFIRKTRI